MDRSVISEEAANQTMLAFEAVFSELPEQGYDEDTLIKITGSHEIGNLVIKVTFEGKPFMPPEPGSDSPEKLILEALEDRLGLQHHSHHREAKLAKALPFERSEHPVRTRGVLADSFPD